MTDLSKTVKEELLRNDITHLVSVANGEAAPLYFDCRDDPNFTVVDACREGEAVGICCGLYLGGARPVLSMENLGLFECMDTLRALPLDMRIPILLIIGYTGRPGPGVSERWWARNAETAQQILTAGEWTEPMLRLAGIPSHVIETVSDAAVVGTAAVQAQRTSRPVALLVERL